MITFWVTESGLVIEDVRAIFIGFYGLVVANLWLIIRQALWFRRSKGPRNYKNKNRFYTSYRVCKFLWLRG